MIFRGLPRGFCGLFVYASALAREIIQSGPNFSASSSPRRQSFLTQSAFECIIFAASSTLIGSVILINSIVANSFLQVKCINGLTTILLSANIVIVLSTIHFIAVFCQAALGLGRVGQYIRTL